MRTCLEKFSEHENDLSAEIRMKKGNSSKILKQLSEIFEARKEAVLAPIEKMGKVVTAVDSNTGTSAFVLNSGEKSRTKKLMDNKFEINFDDQKEESEQPDHSPSKRLTIDLNQRQALDKPSFVGLTLTVSSPKSRMKFIRI